MLQFLETDTQIFTSNKYFVLGWLIKAFSTLVFPIPPLPWTPILLDVVLLTCDKIIPTVHSIDLLAPLLSSSNCWLSGCQGSSISTTSMGWLPLLLPEGGIVVGSTAAFIRVPDVETDCGVEGPTRSPTCTDNLDCSTAAFIRAPVKTYCVDSDTLPKTLVQMLQQFN